MTFYEDLELIIIHFSNLKLWLHVADVENNQGGSDITYSNAEVPLGIWTSVGVTFQLSSDGDNGDAVFYINGVASGGGSSPAPRNIVRGNCWIGRSINWPDSDALLDAALNELKIFNTALSAADFLKQAYSFYSNQGKIIIINQLFYSGRYNNVSFQRYILTLAPFGILYYFGIKICLIVFKKDSVPEKNKNEFIVMIAEIYLK